MDHTPALSVLYLGRNREQVATIQQLLTVDGELPNLAHRLRIAPQRSGFGASPEFSANGSEGVAELHQWPDGPARDAVNGKLSGIGVPVTVRVGHSQRWVAKSAARTQPHLLIVELDYARSSRLAFCRQMRSRPFGPMVVCTGRQPVVSSSACDFFMRLPATRPAVRAMMARFLESWQVPVRTLGILHLHLARQILTLPHTQIELSPKLTQLLAMLMEARGRVVSRAELMAAVWPRNDPRDTRTLDVHIRWLRAALAPHLDGHEVIRTVRGVGYRLAVAELATSRVAT